MLQRAAEIIEFISKLHYGLVFVLFSDLQTQRASDWPAGAAGAGRSRGHSREPPPAAEASAER